MIQFNGGQVHDSKVHDSKVHDSQELARLEVLNSCQILDTAREREFDDITQMASLICDTPIALISLIDEKRQWFKSKVGMDISETSLEIAFCKFTILQDQPLIIPNATEDERFQNHPFVQGEAHIRFYAGFPLVISNAKIGTLCVVDQKPRTLSEKQITILDLLAKQVCDHIQKKIMGFALETSRKLLDDERMRVAEQSRLAALREMSGGLAHEINNPLAIIQTRAAIIEKTVLKENIDREKIIENTRSISAIVTRISRIVMGLKSFASERTVPHPEKIAIKTVIEEALSLCSEKIKNGNIELKLIAASGGPEVLGDRVLLGQVFLNLVNNAYDAVCGTDSAWIQIEVSTLPAGVVLVSVSDSGQPVSEEIQKQMFQPFFTTKEVGKGTGLGLSISNGIVRSHGGVIEYNAKSGISCFHIQLPQIMVT